MGALKRIIILMTKRKEKEKKKGKERKGKERKGKKRKGKERKEKERKGKKRQDCLSWKERIYCLRYIDYGVVVVVVVVITTLYKRRKGIERNGMDGEGKGRCRDCVCMIRDE